MTAALVALAFALESRRDHRAGLVGARPGRATAPASLSGPWGLAWRLQRGGVPGWAVGVLVSAAAIGSIGSMGSRMGEILDSNPQVGDLLRTMGGGASGLTLAFAQAMLGILAVVVTLCGVLLLQRLLGEERRGLAELLLSTGVSRTALAGSHLVWALGLPCLLLLASGALLSAGVGGGPSTGVGDLVGAAAALLPGVLLVVGLAMALVGWAPRRWWLVWVVLGWSMLVSWLGPVLGMPHWLLQLQPWGHLPKLPADDVSWWPVVVETALGLALLAAGLVGYRRRGIPA